MAGLFFYSIPFSLFPTFVSNPFFIESTDRNLNPLIVALFSGIGFAFAIVLLAYETICAHLHHTADGPSAVLILMTATFHSSATR